jgi:hypothetical protein
MTDRTVFEPEKESCFKRSVCSSVLPCHWHRGRAQAKLRIGLKRACPLPRQMVRVTSPHMSRTLLAAHLQLLAVCVHTSHCRATICFFSTRILLPTIDPRRYPIAYTYLLPSIPLQAEPGLGIWCGWQLTENRCWSFSVYWAHDGTLSRRSCSFAHCAHRTTVAPAPFLGLGRSDRVVEWRKSIFFIKRTRFKLRGLSKRSRTVLLKPQTRRRRALNARAAHPSNNPCMHLSRIATSVLSVSPSKRGPTTLPCAPSRPPLI